MDRKGWRMAGLALVVALCAACGSTRYAAYPSDWPERIVPAQGELPDITGRYADAGEAASTNPDVGVDYLQPVSLGRLLFPALRSSPDIELSGMEITRDASSALEFVVHGPESEVLRMRLPRLPDATSAQSTRGYLGTPAYVIVTNQRVVQGEGTSYVHAVTAQFAKTPDGALVVNVVVVDRGVDFLIVPVQGEWSFYFRFPPAP